MKKLILSALAAAALAGSAYTISAVAAPGGPPDGMHEAADFGFMLDARLAGAKAALKLTPDQEKLWPAFETAVRDAAKARAEERKAWREAREEAHDNETRPSPVAMMTRMSDRLAKASDELKKVADAAKPLYDSFDDAQKRHFGPLLHMLHEGGRHGEGHEHGPRPL